MTEKIDLGTVRTRIWREEPEANNPFAAKAAYCRGFDVYGEMLGKARWSEMLFLLFREEPPTQEQADVLDTLAVALANPGPRDPSVHAAMCGGVCGSTAASSLMAALAVGAGQFSGAREVFLAMQGWEACGTDLQLWKSWFSSIGNPTGSVWPQVEHAPGFDPLGIETATPVLQTLGVLNRLGTMQHLAWLAVNLKSMEEGAAHPLAMSGVAATAFIDLGFTPEQGEALYLLLRLPGAAAHALEQRPLGYKKFPFGTIELAEEMGKEQA